MRECELLIGLISNTGFPIVAFLLIVWKFDKSLGLLTEAVIIQRMFSYFYKNEHNYGFQSPFFALK